MEINFIDDNLINYDGHNADYIHSLCNELLKRDIKCSVCCNQRLLIQENSKIKYFKVFEIRSSRLHDLKLLFLNFKYVRIGFSNIIFLKDYFKINKVINQSSLNILNDLSPRNYFGFLFYTTLTSLLGYKFNFLIIFHDRLPNFQFYLLRLMQKLSFRHKFHFSSQSRVISENLKSRFSLDVKILPTPQIFETLDILQHNLNGKLNVTFLGLASKAKGIDFLIDYLKNIIYLNDQRIINKFKFTIQIANIDKELLNNAFENDLEFISNNKELDVTFITEKLNNLEYVDLFNKSHVIIAPYNPFNYKFIQSGVVTQSLSCGKPILLTNDTYCSIEVRELNIGVLFDYGNFEDLTNKLIYTEEHYNIIAADSLSKSAIYRESHGPKKYIDLLLSEFIK